MPQSNAMLVHGNCLCFWGSRVSWSWDSLTSDVWLIWHKMLRQKLSWAYRFGMAAYTYTCCWSTGADQQNIKSSAKWKTLSEDTSYQPPSNSHLFIICFTNIHSYVRETNKKQWVRNAAKLLPSCCQAAAKLLPSCRTLMTKERSKLVILGHHRHLSKNMSKTFALISWVKVHSLIILTVDS